MGSLRGNERAMKWESLGLSHTSPAGTEADDEILLKEDVHTPDAQSGDHGADHALAAMTIANSTIKDASGANVSGPNLPPWINETLSKSMKLWPEEAENLLKKSD